MIQANTNNRWARLSQSEKAELLGIYASKGYNDLANIIAHYNSCGGKLHGDGGPEGGNKVDGGRDKKRKRLAKLIARFAEKNTNGLISADDVNTILAHPTDYMKHLYSDDELNEMRSRLYAEYYPMGYFNREGIPAASDIMQGKESKGEAEMLRNTMRGAILHNNVGSERMRDAYFAQWLGIPEEDRRYPGVLVPASYVPSVGSLDDYPVFSVSSESFPNKDDQIVDTYLAAKQLSGNEFTPAYLMPEKGKGDNYVVDSYTFLMKNDVPETKEGWKKWEKDNGVLYNNAKAPGLFANGLAAFTVGSGIDPQRGQYISMFDKWDINPFDHNGSFGGGLTAKISKVAGIPQNFDATGGVGNPFYIYDRVYLDDYYGVDSRPQNPDEFYGGYIMPTTITANKEASGGKIHIKPENRGKFTALKKRTGHSASWFKAHGTPAQKKMAVFALNAKKWKHDDGGILLNDFADGGDEDPKKIPFWQRMVQGATMAEAPAVMTASGMEINPNGDITYGNDNEGVNRLRDNIATIGTVGALATFAPYLASNPGVMRAVDVVGNIDGIRNLVSKNGISKTIRKAREHDTWGAVRSGVGDALDLVGMGDTARIVSKIASPAYRGYHAYNTILPYSYSQPIRRGLDFLESMALEKKYSQPRWFDSKSEKQFLWNILGKAGASATDFTKRARRDAWAIYTGQPTRYNIYTRNADGSYSYNLDELRKTYGENGLFAPLLKNTVDNTYDFIGGAHGFLSHAEPKLKEVAAGENEAERLIGLLHIDDLWDLQPFKDKAIGDKLSDMLFLHPELSPMSKHVIGALATSKPIEKLNDAMKSFETGRLLGGKPFFMTTDIPFTAVKPEGLHKYRVTFGHDDFLGPIDAAPFDAAERLGIKTSYKPSDVPGTARSGYTDGGPLQQYADFSGFF